MICDKEQFWSDQKVPYHQNFSYHFSYVAFVKKIRPLQKKKPNFEHLIGIKTFIKISLASQIYKIDVALSIVSLTPPCEHYQISTSNQSPMRKM